MPTSEGAKPRLASTLLGFLPRPRPRAITGFGGKFIITQITVALSYDLLVTNAVQ